MKLGTILVPAYDVETVPHAVRAALPFAEKTGARLVGLHIRDRYPAGPVAEYYWHTPVLNEWEQGINERADQLREAFEKAAGSAETEWLQPEGSEVVDLGVGSRIADLIVVAPPNLARRTDSEEVIEAAMIGAGRTTLIAPEGTAKVPEHVLLAWNGSAEAARAAAIARPLLGLASSVTVLSVGAVNDGAPEPGAVAEALTRTGIKAEGRSVPKKFESVTKTLIEEAQNSGADALLLGAYSHSRLRERILGGVTRRLLKDPALPVFMVH